LKGQEERDYMKKFAIALMAVLLLSTFSIAIAADFAPGVSLGLSEGYNDNVLLTRTNRDGSFVTYVSPGASFDLRSSVSDLRVAYTPTFTFYDSNSSLNTTSHNATLDGHYDVSDKLALTISDLFEKSKGISGLLAVANLGPIASIENLLTNTVTGGASYKIANALTWTIGGSYIYSNLSGSNSVIGTAYSNIYSGTSGLAYNLNPRSTVSVNAQYEANQFSTGNDSNDQYYTLGLTHKFTPTLTLAITGGVALSETSNSNNQTTDFVGSAELTKKFEKSTAVLSIAQTIAPGIEYSQPLKTQTASFSLTRPLSERWTAGVMGSYMLFKSLPAPFASDTDIAIVKGEELRLGGNVAYKILPWASAGLSYNFINHLDKTDSTGNYYNNIVLLTFTFSLERPRAEAKPPSE